MTNTTWDFGSIYHWSPYEAHRPTTAPWDSRCTFFGCGRDALNSLIYLGRERRGWRRLWVPSFFCQNVVQSVIDTGIEVRAYPYCAEDQCPGLDRIGSVKGDVLLRMHFFGLHTSLPLDGVDRSAVEVVDDHTHDPWCDMAWSSDVDWYMASLRKVLPIPEGGCCGRPEGTSYPRSLQSHPPEGWRR